MTTLVANGPKSAADEIATMVEEGDVEHAMRELVWWSRKCPSSEYLREQVDLVEGCRADGRWRGLCDAYDAAVRQLVHRRVSGSATSRAWDWQLD